VLEARECFWLRLASRLGARVWLHLVLFTVFLPRPGRRPPRGYRPGGHALAMADLLVVAGIVVFVVAMLALIRGLERI
jgi:hypothetical protein